MLFEEMHKGSAFPLNSGYKYPENISRTESFGSRVAGLYTKGKTASIFSPQPERSSESSARRKVRQRARLRLRSDTPRLESRGDTG
jgi:hypothetical protein